MFVFGLLAAILGNCLIGVGQTLQKLSLNRIASLSYLPPTRSSPYNRHATAPPPAVPLLARAKDKTWLSGIACVYLGEAFGNWVALSFVSAAVVTPLGIVAVLVNALCAERWLGEVVGRRQRRGYAVVALGVLVVLIASPKPKSDADANADVGGGGEGGDATMMRTTTTTAQLLDECCGSRTFVLGMLALVVAAALPAVHLLRRQYRIRRGSVVDAGLTAGRRRGSKPGDGPGSAGAGGDLYAHVAVCALLGAISITCGKVLSVLAREKATATATLASSSTPDERTGTLPFLGIVGLLVLSIVGQEFFRQHAYARFP
ncbi:hypothetical protein HKX48_000721, partial [Thoreauomyces humboldtii]